jgi:hypothetical protein
MARKLLLKLKKVKPDRNFSMGPIFDNAPTTVVYKDHTIACHIALSPDEKHFFPRAAISWKRQGRLLVYFLRSDKKCSNGEDANAVALEEAKLWVDRHQLEFER